MLPLIPQDKANHIIYGLAIYLLSDLVVTSWIALIIVSLFAIGKEVYDYFNQGNVELLDAVCTVSVPIFLFLKNLFKL